MNWKKGLCCSPVPWYWCWELKRLKFSPSWLCFNSMAAKWNPSRFCRSDSDVVKYVASDGLKINKLNDGRSKEANKVQTQVEDIADDLIKLYAERSQLEALLILQMMKIRNLNRFSIYWNRWSITFGEEIRYKSNLDGPIAGWARRFWENRGCYASSL